MKDWLRVMGAAGVVTGALFTPRAQKKTGDLGDVGRRRSLERVERGVRESFGVAYTEKLEGLWLSGKYLDENLAELADEPREDKNKLLSKTAISELFVANGVKKDDFDKAWHSFIVQSKLKRAIGLTSQYGIKSVPTMVVNGKFQTNATMATLNKPTASGHQTALEVVDWLIEKERVMKKITTKK